MLVRSKLRSNPFNLAATVSNAPLVHAALLVLLPRAAAAQIVRPLLRWPGRRLSPLLRRLTARIPQQPQAGVGQTYMAQTRLGF